ncbi:MAG: DUF819 family protein [Bacteroidota bacterium]
MQPYFTNDAVLFGILMGVLALVFWTSQLESKFWTTFYKYIPVLLLAYFLPALLRWPLGLIAPEWTNAAGEAESSQLYFVASRYLLPACLILLCISIDIKGIINLGPKAIIMFLAASLGIILGGPVALLIVTSVFPDLIPVPKEELWRGFSTVAGSWIGGGANQTAMKEIFEVGDNLFGMMIIVDILVANIWMGFLLYGINISDRLDKRLRADNSAIEKLKASVSSYRASIEKIPTVTTTFVMMGLAFGGTALSHWGADTITPIMKSYSEQLNTLKLNSLMSHFFWLIVIATSIGFVLSFTKAKKLEGVGASRWGTIFIYILVATIGMKMNLAEIFDKENAGLLLIGLIWMMIHVLTLIIVAVIIRAPYFFIAVGSQANVGGAASAPVVAAAFDPALAPVGVLMAVLGYALGTYGALICALMMQGVAT